MSVYQFSALDVNGVIVSLREFRGKALLIVNTASECKYTPQYQELQETFDIFGEEGLQVLAFPCNQFGHQEPDDNETIQLFCKDHYGVTFPVLAKIDVNGENAHALYQYLTTLGNQAGPITWNFTKFLFDREGHFIGRFEPGTSPAAMIRPIEKVLG